MRLRTVSAALAAAALALTAGCGSSADVASGGSGSTSGSSADAAASGSGASDEGVTSLTADNFADVLSSAQLKATSVHMTMSGEAMGQSMKVESDLALDKDPAKSAARMTMDVAGSAVTVVLVDQTVYTQAAGMPEGKWMKVDLGDAAGMLGGMQDSLDPAKQLESLKSAITKVEDSGETEQIDGVEARRYDVVVDTSKLTSGVPAASASSIPDQLTYSYWVGSDDLPRKVVVDLPDMPIEMSFSKWGEPVEVEAPPAADVIDGSSYLKSMPTP